MNQRFATRSFAWLGAAALLMVPAGSARAQTPESVPAAPAASAPASMPGVSAQDQNKKQAADAAWAVLMALREYVHASQIFDNPHERTQALSQASKTLGDLTGLHPDGDAETLKTYVALWPAVVARYVDGFQRDRLDVSPMPPGDQQVKVVVVAANPQDQKIYDQLSQQVTKSLQDQGYSGQDLASRRHVVLTRELAQRGIGDPVAAVIVLAMRKIDGQWKATELAMQPPRVQAAGSQPVRGLPGMQLQQKPATQPGK